MAVRLTGRRGRCCVGQWLVLVFFAMVQGLAFAGAKEFYIGLGAGQSEYDYSLSEVAAQQWLAEQSQALGQPVERAELDTKDQSYRAYLGYRFGYQYLFELGYQDLGRVSFSGELSSGGRIEESSELTGVDVSLGYFLPLNKKFWVPVKLGVLAWTLTGDNNFINSTETFEETGVSPLVSIGLWWRMSRSWRLFLDAQWVADIAEVGHFVEEDSRANVTSVHLGLALGF